MNELRPLKKGRSERYAVRSDVVPAAGVDLCSGTGQGAALGCRWQPIHFRARSTPRDMQREEDAPLWHPLLFGAGGGGRTRTVSLPPDFESGTSANSITPACVIYSYDTTAREQIQELFART